jgi:hypothetical protein
MKELKFNYFYKTENLINGKFYYGVHKTNDLNDGYFGSGRRILYAIKKYGKDNFKKENILFFDTFDEALNYESEYVDEVLLLDPSCYNINLGGKSGFRSLWMNPEWVKNFKIVSSERLKKLHREGKCYPPDRTGRKHKEETKIKMKTAFKKINHQQKEKNSQFGTYWIHNDEENKKIKKEELNLFLEQGWIKGRNMKFNHKK